jgi:hypothetical protein
MFRKTQILVRIGLFVSALTGMAILAGCGGGSDAPPPPPVVNPPAAFTVANDSFTMLGNTAITVPAANGVLVNDVGTDGTVTFTTAATQGTVSTTGLTGGAFTYQPPTGVVLPFTDTFTYTATAPDSRKAIGTVTVTVNEEAWYVRNNFAGTPNGSSTAPFTTLAAAAAAAGPNERIFVFAGDGTDTGQNLGIALADGQRLIGEGMGLTFDVRPNGTPLAAPLTVVPTGAFPLLSNTDLANDPPVVSLANNNEVAGIRMQALAGVNAVAAFVQGTGVTGFNIHDNEFVNSLAEDVLLVDPVGTGSITNNGLMTGARRASVSITNIDPVNATVTDINAVITVSDNTITSPLNEGILVALDGVAATSLQLTAAANNIDASGRNGISLSTLNTTVGAAVQLSATLNSNSVTTSAGRGIIADALNESTINLRMSGNTVTGSSNPGIDLLSDNTARFNAVVAGSQLSTNAGANEDFQANPLGASNFCLELTNSTSENGFLVDNGSTVALRFFEAGNNVAATQVATVGAVTIVAQGACGI